MSTLAHDHSDLDLSEQIACINRTNAELTKRNAETLVALKAEARKHHRDPWMGWVLIGAIVGGSRGAATGDPPGSGAGALKG